MEELRSHSLSQSADELTMDDEIDEFETDFFANNSTVLNQTLSSNSTANSSLVATNQKNEEGWETPEESEAISLNE